MISLSENTLLKTTRRLGIDKRNQQMHRLYPLWSNASHVDADEFGIADCFLDEGLWVRTRKHQPHAGEWVSRRGSGEVAERPSSVAIICSMGIDATKD